MTLIGKFSKSNPIPVTMVKDLPITQLGWGCSHGNQQQLHAQKTVLGFVFEELDHPASVLQGLCFSYTGKATDFCFTVLYTYRKTD